MENSENFAWLSSNSADLIQLSSEREREIGGKIVVVVVVFVVLN